MTGIEDIPNELIVTLSRNDALNRAHRAGYLAGIAAARECVPDTDPFSGGTDRDKDNQVTGQIHFRSSVLANLSALEQGVGK